MSRRTLHIARDLSLPLDAATQTLLILGKRGSGKSSTATRFVEQLIDAHVPVAVLDPVDVWWGLKAGAAGTREGGKEVYIFGGRHADLPLEPTAGELMADVLVDHRINAVMVLREFSNREKAQFAAGFADRLFRRNVEVVHLVVEEAHELIPERPFSGEEEMVGRMIRLQKLGRSSGIGLTAVTQRAASLNKNITTQSEILISHRIIGPQDRDAIEEWIKHHHQQALKQQVLSTLPELKTGEAWVWAPDFPEKSPIGLRRVHFLMPTTFDSRRTPKPGERRREPKQLAAVDLEKLGEKMAATRERAKQTDPRHLQTEVARLRAELARKPQAPRIEPPARVEIPIITDAQVKKLDQAVRRAIDAQARFERDTTVAHDRLVTAYNRLTAALSDSKMEVAGILDAIATARGKGALSTAVQTRPAPVAPHRSVQVRVEPKPAASIGDKLGLAERKILTALAQYPQGRTKTQVAVLTAYAVNGGGFNNAVGSLRSKWFIAGTDVLQVTEAGLDALGDWTPLPEPGPELLEFWKRQLGHAEREILRVLTEAYPQMLTREDIAGLTVSPRGTPYAPDGGGFNNALGRLRTLELIEGRGTLKASDDLMGGGQ